MKIFGPDDNNARPLLKSNLEIRFITADKKVFPISQKRIVDNMKFPLEIVSTIHRVDWDAVWQVGQQDQAGNVTSGDTLLSNSKNSLVYASSRLVSAVRVENIIIETVDTVLVADRKNSQDVKNIVNQLETQKREEKNLHRKVNRPRDCYDSVDEGDRFKVERIQVKPGASLSLQMQHHRTEHWIIIKGMAEIINGDQVITLNENQSIYIPQGQTQRLANRGTESLEIIEVQSGSYLGEDDIVRFEDTYGRS